MREGQPITSELQHIKLPAQRRLMMELAQRGLELLVSELGLELFRQPALEMLFELYGNPELPRRYLTALVSVSSTSGRNSQRIVHRMKQRSLVQTDPDFEDGRRTIVELTEKGRSAIDSFLDRWLSSEEFRSVLDEQIAIRCTAKGSIG